MSQVQKLTGLTSNQLREWTNRRKLIKPDVEPSGSGTRALYSWQTVLILRLAATLKNKFHVELKAKSDLFASLSRQLDKVSFLSLQGCVLIVDGAGEFMIVKIDSVTLTDVEGIIIQLDSHLEALAKEFELPIRPKQLNLFPATIVR